MIIYDLDDFFRGLVMIIYDLDDFFKGHNSIHKFIDLTADESKPIVTYLGITMH